MGRNGTMSATGIKSIGFRALLFLALLWIVVLVIPPCAIGDERAEPSLDMPDPSGLLSLYDFGIPQSVSKEWTFPTGFSFRISGGYHLHEGVQDETTGFTSKMNLFPLSFLMRIPLYKTRRISQSIGFGLGPYFLHQGPMPIHLSDVRVTCSSTCLTEWMTRVSNNLYLNLRMKYTYALQSLSSQVPLGDFTTRLGLKLRW